MSTPNKPLTAMKQAFVDEYIIDFHGTNAAIRAGYSKKTADQQASRLLKEPRISAAIAEALEARTRRTQIDADWVLQRAASMLEADVADIIDEQGRYLPVKEWPKVWRQMLAGIDIKELWDGSGKDREQIGEVAKIRFIDRLKALELVGKHVDVQAFREKVEVEGKMSFTIVSGIEAAPGSEAE